MRPLPLCCTRGIAQLRRRPSKARTGTLAHTAMARQPGFRAPGFRSARMHSDDSGVSTIWRRNATIPPRRKTVIDGPSFLQPRVEHSPMGTQIYIGTELPIAFGLFSRSWGPYRYTQIDCRFLCRCTTIHIPLTIQHLPFGLQYDHSH